MLESFVVGFVCGLITAPLAGVIFSSIRQKRRRKMTKIYMTLAD